MTMDILLEWGLSEVHNSILGLLNDTYFMNGYTSAEISNKEYPQIHFWTQSILYAKGILTRNNYYALGNNWDPTVYMIQNMSPVYLYFFCKFVQAAWRWPYTTAETYLSREGMKIKRFAVHTLSFIICTLSVNHSGDIPIEISLLSEAWPRIEDSSWYTMPYKCSQVCIRYASHCPETRFKDYHRDICVQHLDNLAVAEHSCSVDHRIQLQKTIIISANSDATEIEHQSNSIN